MQTQTLPVQSIFATAPNLFAKADPPPQRKEIKLNTDLFDSEEKIVLYGSDRQKALGAALDKLLSQITKGSSPVLFELFNQLKKGIGDTNIGELETSIKDSLNKSWWHSVLDSIGLSSAAKRLEKANTKIGSMLSSKSKSLLDLTQSMEANLNVEVQKLVGESKMLAALADEYRKNVSEFKELSETGKVMLEDAQKEGKRLFEYAANTGQPLDLEAAKNFKQKVNLFENRLLVIDTIYTKAPAELEAIRLAREAGFQTIAETASSASEEFSDIKSILIKLAIAHTVQSVQGINAERRKLRDQLSAHGTNVLENVAVTAARSAGVNRMEDAQKLLDFTSKIATISDKVIAEGEQNKTRFADARESLSKVKQLLNK